MVVTKEYIANELTNLEQALGIRVLYACESGSRAWGFASQDSDYDVRFIYIHEQNWYLSVRDRRDVIERQLEHDLDVSGWDIRKALMLFRKSNPPLLEWLQSPIVYKEDELFTEKLRSLIPTYYSPRAYMYHYHNLAAKTFRESLQGERVKAKKYFYALRPLFACKWIESSSEAPPMEFAELMGKLELSDELKNAITELLEQKRQSQERDEQPRIEVIHQFIQTELENLDMKSVVTCPRDVTFEPLDEGDSVQKLIICDCCFRWAGAHPTGRP
jgi:uncharacterized protein